MSWKSSLLAAIFLCGAICLCSAEPISFQEISLLFRTGETPQNILNEVARRKLLMRLAADEEVKLAQSGASAALITALRNPTLLASPDELQSYLARRRLQTQARVSAAAGPQATAPAQPQAIVLPDHFSEWLETAKTAPARTLTASDAFNLTQLDEIRAKARADRKPIGFLVVSKKCFGQPYNTRQTSPYAATLHFLEAFKEPLVLAFVPDDGKVAVPEAVARGIKGAAGSNPVPFMVVVDAGATELIGVVPSGDNKADGLKRDEIFKASAGRIQEWLSFHPTAVSAGVAAAH